MKGRNRMKIAFDAYPIASKKLSGIGIHAENIASRICRMADCELLLYDFFKRHGSAAILESRIPGAPIRECNLMPYGAYVKIWDYIPLCYNSLFGSDADIYHFFNFLVPPKVKGKIVNTVHDLVFFTFPETVEKSNLRRMTANIGRSCDMSDIIICVSENGKRELIDIMKVPEDKIRVVYNGVNHEKFNPSVPEYKNNSIPKDYILYIGTLEPRKNLVTLIKAYAGSNARKNGCALVIAGAKGWECDEIFRLANEYKTEVHFTGYVPNDQLPSLYKSARAFAFPSLYEGFGIPPLEAMACGTPVVTSCSSSLPEVVGDAALTIENPLDSEALAHSIDRIVFDSETAINCSEAGLVQSKKFTWDESAHRVMKIYKELS